MDVLCFRGVTQPHTDKVNAQVQPFMFKVVEEGLVCCNESLDTDECLRIGGERVNRPT